MALRSLLAFSILVNCGGGEDPDTDMDGSTSAPTTGETTLPTTGEADDLPPPAEVCANACAKFAECTPSTPTCVSDCEAGIEFMAMNNPGTGCATYETGRMDCLSQLTCDELDVYRTDPEATERPCQAWIDLEADSCAIE